MPQPPKQLQNPLHRSLEEERKVKEARRRKGHEVRKKRRKIARDPEERSRVAQIRQALPAIVPEGWRPIHNDVKRVNDFSGPGIYARVYEGRGMKICFLCNTEGKVVVRLCALRGTLTPQMIRTAKESWYPGLKAGHTEWVT